MQVIDRRVNLETEERQPRRRPFFKRLWRYISWPGPGVGIPTRALHPPLPGEVMRNKIKEPLISYLESHGFKEAENQWTWIRPRTAWINDYIYAALLTKSAPELYGVNLYVGIQCPPISQLLAEFSGGRYELTRPLLRPLIHIPYLPKQHIPSRWNFWSKAFDDEEMDDMLWHLEHYGLPFMVSFSTLDDLVVALNKYASLFHRDPENVAAILAFAGRNDEALQGLEMGVRTVKGMSEDQKSIINTMIDALHKRTLQAFVNERKIT